MTETSDTVPTPDDDGDIEIQDAITGLDQTADYVKDIQKQEADTTRRLAFISVLLLGGYIFFHYIAMIIIGILALDSLLTSLEDIFSAALPVLSGLAGSAATYFFTRNKT